MSASSIFVNVTAPPSTGKERDGASVVQHSGAFSEVQHSGIFGEVLPSEAHLGIRRLEVFGDFQSPQESSVKLSTLERSVTCQALRIVRRPVQSCLCRQPLLIPSIRSDENLRDLVNPIQLVNTHPKGCATRVQEAPQLQAFLVVHRASWQCCAFLG